ncbi:MauE/DoxX family redox-associated membrane protein [Actinokineospora sp. 24-640]
MLTLTAGVAAGTVLVTLLIASFEHLRAPHVLPSALIAHRVLPRSLAKAAAACVIAVEGALGIALLAGLLGFGGVVSPALAASGLLFTGYGAYALFIVRSGRTGPCGCGGVEVPMDAWVAARAFALAAMALGAAVSRAVPPLTPVAPPSLVVLLAAATFAVLLWQLPAARHVQGGRRAPREGVR